MIYYDDIVLCYEYFYKNTKNSKKYQFKPSEKASKSIQKFLNRLNERYNLNTLGFNFLWKYFNFQFMYWEELTIEAFWGKMQVEFIIGDKAFQRYLDRDTEFDFILEQENNNFAKKYGIRLSDLKKIKNNHEHLKVDLHIKKKFYNTERGFDACIQFTTLFNPKHSICLTCNYKKECKELLRVNYPKIYESRKLK